MSEAHEMTQAEREELFTDFVPIVAPSKGYDSKKVGDIKHVRPSRHRRTECACPDPAKLINPDAVHDAVLDEDGAEVIDLRWDEPRTATACNKVTKSGLCTCPEFVPGQTIGRDHTPSCADCHDTEDSHKPRTTSKKARRQ